MSSHVDKTMYEVTIIISISFSSPLDESHMKVGVRALARLHALSYAYFKRYVLPYS